MDIPLDLGSGHHHPLRHITPSTSYVLHDTRTHLPFTFLLFPGCLRLDGKNNSLRLQIMITPSHWTFPSGISLFMNHSLLVFFIHFIPGTLGSSDDPSTWENWIGRCAVCFRMILEGGGIFCVNFATPRLHWSPCEKAWRGKCYAVSPNDTFPVKCPLDEDGVEVREAQDKYRFVQGRNGDNLLTPFQYDMCHF